MKRRPKMPAPRPAKLFSEPAHPVHAHVAYVDGASRGNPGPASYAVVLRAPDGTRLDRIAKAIGHKTNNEAEYYALVAALDYALSHGIGQLRVRTDSELLAQQMNGRYKVKSAALRPLHENAARLARQFSYFSIEHVPREQNREADRLANEVLDQGGTAEAPATRSRTIRARYEHGKLVPAEPLSLEEGAEVEIILRRRG